MKHTTNTNTATVNLALINDAALATISRARTSAVALAFAEAEEIAARAAVKRAEAAEAAEETIKPLRATLEEKTKARKAAGDLVKVMAQSIIDMGTVYQSSIFIERDSKSFDVMTMLSSMGVIIGDPGKLSNKAIKKVIAPLSRFFDRHYDYIKSGKVVATTRNIKTTPKEIIIGVADILLNSGAFVTTDNYGLALRDDLKAVVSK